MSPIKKAEKLVSKGKYKRALKILARTFKKYSSSLDLAKLRFEYGKFIPFDKLHHDAARDYFRLQIRYDVSAQKIHEDFVKYMTTTQGRISLDDELYIRLSIIFSANGFENNGLFLINQMIRVSCREPLFAEALVAMINYLDDKNHNKKSDYYKQYLIDNFPEHEMTHYIKTKRG